MKKLKLTAGNDEFFGYLIAETIDKIRHDEIISIESSSSSETYVMTEEGMKVTQHYIEVNIASVE